MIQSRFLFSENCIQPEVLAALLHSIENNANSILIVSVKRIEMPLTYFARGINRVLSRDLKYMKSAIVFTIQMSFNYTKDAGEKS